MPLVNFGVKLCREEMKETVGIVVSMLIVGDHKIILEIFWLMC